MILTIDRCAILSNLMVAFKRGDLNKYLQLLERCKSWMSEDLYGFYFNLGSSKQFNRKDYFRC